jgi:hypothetical protein
MNWNQLTFKPFYGVPVHFITNYERDCLGNVYSSDDNIKMEGPDDIAVNLAFVDPNILVYTTRR